MFDAFGIDPHLSHTNHLYISLNTYVCEHAHMVIIWSCRHGAGCCVPVLGPPTKGGRVRHCVAWASRKATWIPLRLQITS